MVHTEKIIFEEVVFPTTLGETGQLTVAKVRKTGIKYEAAVGATVAQPCYQATRDQDRNRVVRCLSEHEC